MKTSITLLLLIITRLSYGQGEAETKEKPKSISVVIPGYGDNRNGSSAYFVSKQILVKDHLMFTTYSLQLTPTEKEIFDVEALECTANLRRDTITLRNLWDRDFSIDEPVNEVVTGKNTLPYYVSFTRMIENFMQKDDMVYTSGYEMVQRLRPDLKPEEPVRQNFYHTWLRKNGAWKLVAKGH